MAQTQTVVHTPTSQLTMPGAGNRRSGGISSLATLRTISAQSTAATSRTEHLSSAFQSPDASIVSASPLSVRNDSNVEELASKVNKRLEKLDKALAGSHEQKSAKMYLIFCLKECGVPLPRDHDPENELYMWNHSCHALGVSGKLSDAQLTPSLAERMDNCLSRDVNEKALPKALRKVLERTKFKATGLGSNYEIDCLLHITAPEFTFKDAVDTKLHQFVCIKPAVSLDALEVHEPPAIPAQAPRLLKMEVGTDAAAKLIQLGRDLHIAFDAYWTKYHKDRVIPPYDAGSGSNYMRCMCNSVLAVIVATPDATSRKEMLVDMLQGSHLPHLAALAANDKLFAVSQARASSLAGDMLLDVHASSQRNMKDMKQLVADFKAFDEKMDQLDQEINKVKAVWETKNAELKQCYSWINTIIMALVVVLAGLCCVIIVRALVSKSAVSAYQHESKLTTQFANVETHKSLPIHVQGQHLDRNMPADTFSLADVQTQPGEEDVALGGRSSCIENVPCESLLRQHFVPPVP